jgi:hypothetical protein
VFLDTSISGRDTVYLIVGFRVLHDGEVDRTSTSKRTDGAAQGEAPANPEAPAPVAPGMSGSRSSGDTQQLSYKTQEEQVFAVLYRKVKLRCFSVRSVDNMALEADCRWNTFWDWQINSMSVRRRGRGRQVVMVRITEATLVDDDVEGEEGEEEEEASRWRLKSRL